VVFADTDTGLVPMVNVTAPTDRGSYAKVPETLAPKLTEALEFDTGQAAPTKRPALPGPLAATIAV
jgi:hypothetical protein